MAGDDDPYYRYKRGKLLRRFLADLPVAGKRLLELGCGPGGNLLQLARSNVTSVVGIDISAAMLNLAQQTLAKIPVPLELKKTDGRTLPLADRSVDFAFTVTVLQHNVEPAALYRVVAELCRVTADLIVIMEDTGTMRTAPVDSTYIRRQIDAYREEFAQHGFGLVRTTYLGLYYSRRVHRAIRRRLVPPTHREGQPLPAMFKIALTAALAGTRLLDDVASDTEDLTCMTFVRDTHGR